MMKISLQLPTGLRIDFEGGPEEFNRFTEFVGELPEFMQTVTPGAEGGLTLSPGADQNALGTGDGDGSPLDPQELHARLQQVGATTDIQRVTVMAQAALDAGLDALDYGTVDRLYKELGLKKPPRWPKTFSNAKQRNYVRSVGQGKWRPTVVGENFARGLGSS